MSASIYTFAKYRSVDGSARSRVLHIWSDHRRMQTMVALFPSRSRSHCWRAALLLSDKIKMSITLRIAVRDSVALCVALVVSRDRAMQNAYRSTLASRVILHEIVYGFVSFSAPQNARGTDMRHFHFCRQPFGMWCDLSTSCHTPRYHRVLDSLVDCEPGFFGMLQHGFAWNWANCQFGQYSITVEWRRHRLMRAAQVKPNNFSGEDQRFVAILRFRDHILMILFIIFIYYLDLFTRKKNQIEINCERHFSNRIDCTTNLTAHSSTLTESPTKPSVRVAQ